MRRDGQGLHRTTRGWTRRARPARGCCSSPGRNMAGKSTYLRRLALLAVMAQAGAFVPAKRCGLGWSTACLRGWRIRRSGPRALHLYDRDGRDRRHPASSRRLSASVVLDEIGRGTATFDGLAIAWAAAEHLHDVNKCRAVFATHYHELTRLAEKMRPVANAHLRAKEWKGDLVFLHEVAPGPADRSYGIQVAKLAGLPKSAVDRARAVLQSSKPAAVRRRSRSRTNCRCSRRRT